MTYREPADMTPIAIDAHEQCAAECHWQLYRRWRTRASDFDRVDAHRCAACRCWRVTVTALGKAEELALDSDVVVAELGTIGPAYLEPCEDDEEEEETPKPYGWREMAISCGVSLVTTAVAWLTWWLA